MAHFHTPPSTPEKATPSKNLAMGVLLCLFIGASTYVLWHKFISPIRHQQSHQIPKTDATSRNGLTSGSEHDAIRVDDPEILDTKDIDHPRAVSSTENDTKYSPPQRTTDESPKPKLRPEEYTVGWICAIMVELVAAQVFLDEVHAGPDHRDGHDANSYVLGKFGEHNTVIATLPDGNYGKSSATGVIKDLLRTFPNVRFGLMVGVGGGVPSQKHDIRLGDVVVSSPGDGNSGVFQYDFGKSIQDQTFHTTGFLNAPPIVLRTAVTTLKAQYEMDDDHLQNTIHSLLQTNRKLWEGKYKRPETSSDILYCSDFMHRSTHGGECKDSCGSDPKTLVSRQPRSLDDRPLVHFGLIASGDSLMKDAKIRDRLGAEQGVMCFEMEAAGLMNHFPCLVIRGICDYSDTHKNKAWQRYAAVTAAAYTKDLLRQIPPLAIQTEPKASEILSGIHQLAQEKEKEQCHQIFRLTTAGKDSTYEWYKGRIEKRVEGTCEWFLHHTNFKNWQQQKSGPLLVSADPGCGKSVLAKYLVDEILPGSATICYFFFKDQDQNTIQQALCALLHQLFTHRPALIEHAMEPFKQNGQQLSGNKALLWNILRAATQDPRAGSIVLVLDALDECIESEFTELMEMLRMQLRNDQHRQSNLKYLLTSRPYEQIVSEFGPLLDQFPFIRIPGEEESDSISREVNLVISHRVTQLSKMKNLSPSIKEKLQDKLQTVPHRTYLWVYLVFDFLKKRLIQKTSTAVGRIFSELPQSVNAAYEDILDRSLDPAMAQKALAVVLAASRPLTVSEMNIAMNIHDETGSLCGLDLESDTDFKSTLRAWCGLFVSVHHSKVYFLHQTAREFLLMKLSRDAPSTMKWHRSISSEYAHGVLANICVRYLNFVNCMDGVFVDKEQQGPLVFLKYSANFWADHIRIADNGLKDEFLRLVLEIYNPHSKVYCLWLRIFCKERAQQDIKFTELTMASSFGHTKVAQMLLNQGADLESKDDTNGQTPLLWAAKRGHEAVAKLLIDHGADLESKDTGYSQTPLSWAAENGHEAVAKLLIDHGADIESKDDINGQTPLSWAAENSHEAVAKLLIDQGADIKSKDRYSRTPLLRAAENGHEAVAKLLIDHGADLESKDDINGQTPLLWAAENSHEAIAKLLIDHGADLESKSTRYSQTPLLWAAENSHEAIAKLLIGHGADLESKSTRYSQTPLLWAAENSHEAIAKLLINHGADLESKDRYRRTPLSWAAKNGHEAVAKLLINHGADLESKDRYSRTPLLRAAENGHEAVAKLLIDHGADLESKDIYNRTPLLRVAENGYKAIAKLLIDHGADLESKDTRYSRTPLSWAAKRGHKAVAKLLIDHGADIELKDRYSRTPLLRAAENGHEAVAKLLIDHGADLESRDIYSRTPLLRAAENGHEAVAKLLIDHGADLESMDADSQTSLLWAADNGHKAVAKLLTDHGASPS